MSASKKPGQPGGGIESRSGNASRKVIAQDESLERSVFVARQPIFDHKLEVYGYELLFRSGRENHYAFDNGDQMLETRQDAVSLKLANVIDSSENNIFRKFTAYFGL